MSQSLREKIASFDQWHYQFELEGELTPAVRGEQSVRRHNQRKRHFFDPLVELFGGNLEGKRVLDIGCNAGFWSLHAIEAGCDFVLGVDGRQMHVDQANLVFETKRVDASRYRFLRSNIFDLDLVPFGQFDIVLCLGFLYHINKPIELLERISAVNSDFLLIDTAVDSSPESLLRVVHENLTDPRHAADYELVLWPTRRAVIDMARLFGYQAVALQPEFDDYTGLEDFQAGGRRAFFCSRETDLSRLSAKVEAI